MTIGFHFTALTPVSTYHNDTCHLPAPAGLSGVRAYVVCVCVCVCACLWLGGCTQHRRLNTGSVVAKLALLGGG